MSESTPAAGNRGRGGSGASGSGASAGTLGVPRLATAESSRMTAVCRNWRRSRWWDSRLSRSGSSSSPSIHQIVTGNVTAGLPNIDSSLMVLMGISQGRLSWQEARDLQPGDLVCTESGVRSAWHRHHAAGCQPGIAARPVDTGRRSNPGHELVGQLYPVPRPRQRPGCQLPLGWTVSGGATRRRGRWPAEQFRHFHCHFVTPRLRRALVHRRAASTTPVREK